jgi:hypothetical protein
LLIEAGVADTLLTVGAAYTNPTGRHQRAKNILKNQKRFTIRLSIVSRLFLYASIPRTKNLAGNLGIEKRKPSEKGWLVVYRVKNARAKDLLRQGRSGEAASCMDEYPGSTVLMRKDYL